MATPGKHLDSREKERIRELASQGVKTRDIAEAMRVSPNCVRQIIKKSS